jgi:hypothetical protein
MPLSPRQRCLARTTLEKSIEGSGIAKVKLIGDLRNGIVRITQQGLGLLRHQLVQSLPLIATNSASGADAGNAPTRSAYPNHPLPSR